MVALSADTLAALNDGAPAALAERRSRAHQRFMATPMPSSKDAAWKYVDLDLDLDGYRLASGSGEDLGPDPVTDAFTDLAARVVLRDGSLAEVENRSKALIESDLDRWGRGDAILDLISSDTDKFAAAGTAFGAGGVAIEIPEGVVITDPILVDIQTTESGSISFPAVSLNLKEGSQASVVLVMRSSDDVDALVVPRMSLAIGDSANLSYTLVQQLGASVTSIGHQRVKIGRAARARLGEVGLGGLTARLDLVADLEGDGAGVDFVGLSFGEHRQVLDYRMVINHIGKNTTSQVYLKGAVEDEAQSIFSGLLRIERGATGSSAFETNRNLVLSPGAKANSVPNLEILCDDVICGHGSSVGPLEEEHLYYLQSRGLSRARAERLLIRGFFSEVIGRLPHPQLADPVKEAVYRRFEVAQVEGRVR